MKSTRKKYYDISTDDKESSVLKEPALAYDGSALPSLRAILGGKVSGINPIFSDTDMIKASREGLKKETLYSLADYLAVSMEQLSGLLHTSYRNLLRKDSSDLLDSYKTEKVLELAAFVRRGIQVIGSLSGFQEWTHSPILGLGNRKPLEFLDTTFGIQAALKELGRLEQGVYS